MMMMMLLMVMMMAGVVKICSRLIVNVMMLIEVIQVVDCSAATSFHFLLEQVKEAVKIVFLKPVVVGGKQRLHDCRRRL